MKIQKSEIAITLVVIQTGLEIFTLENTSVTYSQQCPVVVAMFYFYHFCLSHMFIWLLIFARVRIKRICRPLLWIYPRLYHVHEIFRLILNMFSNFFYPLYYLLRHDYFSRINEDEPMEGCQLLRDDYLGILSVILSLHILLSALPSCTFVPSCVFFSFIILYLWLECLHHRKEIMRKRTIVSKQKMGSDGSNQHNKTWLFLERIIEQIYVSI